MRLFEAILDANHRALAGDPNAGLHPADFADELPVVALTCIDPRLNPLFPEVLGLPKEQFIWLRNAGNIITGPLSSTMRSLALACAVKGGKEIAVIGHNDCQVCKTSAMKLTDAFRALGIDRSALPENLTEYFGLFASERQNVITATDHVRRSPLIGPKIAVHGLMVDIGTGKLEWIVNGYQTLETATAPPARTAAGLAGEELDAMKNFAEFKIGEMKFPETKIGELATEGKDWLAREVQQLQGGVPSVPHSAPYAPAPPPVERRIPLPPRLRPTINVRKWKK
jgi:carbonic anhydrase